MVVRPGSDVSAGPLRIALRALTVLLINAFALLVLSELLDGFVLDGPGAALGAAALVGLSNALIWPLMARFTLPLSVLTLGGAAIVLNAALVTLVLELIPGAELSGLWEGVLVTVGLTLITALLSSLLAIGDEDAWRRNVLQRGLRHRGDAIETEVPGVLFLEIDGLAHEVLERALRAGTTPNLASWIEGGSHLLQRWETDLSSQTGACQAGLLHGSNDDMPAFRWWEKDKGKAIVTNHPRDAAEIERRHSDGRGLLHAGGASRANILSGDAPHSMLTMSTVLHRRRPLGRDYAAYFAQPYAVIKTAGGAIADFWRERRYAARQRRRDVRPRIERSRAYAAARAWATAVQLDLQVAAVVGDVIAGRPLVYSTFLAYDEVAHHSGIERVDALAVLAKLDREIGRIASALQSAPRPYEIVVLSDHGQTQGATFLQRYGLTLEDLVRDSCRAQSVLAEGGGEDEASAYIGAGLTELRRDDTAAGRTVRTMTRKRTDESESVQIPSTSERHESAGGAGAYGARPRPGPGGDGEPEIPELSVMASGCLGLISFPREPGRLGRERIERLHPGLIAALAAHPGVGFVLVRDERKGAIALGTGGSHRLCDGEVEGEDPLAPFGPNVARHLRRTDGFAHCPDLLVNSSYWPESDEVAAFEELVGSHGGIGGPQSHPFLLRPTDLPWPQEAPVGAETVHQLLRRWLDRLGHSGYGPAESPGEGISTAS